LQGREDKLSPQSSTIWVALVVGAAVFIDPADARAQTAANSAVVAPIGKITEMQGTVSVEHKAMIVVQASVGSAAPPKVGDAVYKGDVVQTNSDGKVSLIFADGTAFNVARNARVELNEFVYDPDSKANSAKFSLLKGTLTFVAGASAKSGSMTIETPVGTMGIRGTTPRVEIMDDGSVKFSTLVEDDKTPPATSPGVRPPTSQQRRADSAPSQDTAAYNRFMSWRPKICQTC